MGYSVCNAELSILLYQCQQRHNYESHLIILKKCGNLESQRFATSSMDQTNTVLAVHCSINDPSLMLSVFLETKSVLEYFKCLLIPFKRFFAPLLLSLQEFIFVLKNINCKLFDAFIETNSLGNVLIALDFLFIKNLD